MTRALLIPLVLVALTCFLPGCQEETESLNDAVKPPEQATEQLPPPLVDLDPVSTGVLARVDISADANPQQVVGRFLQALRDGDDQVVAGLLTVQARQETARHGLVVRPPGTPAADFQVGSVEKVEGGAYVNCTWTEASGGVAVESFDIVWVLRQQDDGWRVAGMATRVLPGQAPTFLNFEEPAEMLRKWRQIDDVLVGQGSDVQRTATDPRNRLRR
jgi:hypothetical protein